MVHYGRVYASSSGVSPLLFVAEPAGMRCVNLPSWGTVPTCYNWAELPPPALPHGNLNALARAVHANAVAKGFWAASSEQPLNDARICQCLLLIHDELMERHEVRNGHEYYEQQETADVALRTLDLMAALGVRVDQCNELPTDLRMSYCSSAVTHIALARCTRALRRRPADVSVATALDVPLNNLLHLAVDCLHTPWETLLYKHFANTFRPMRHGGARF